MKAVAGNRSLVSAKFWDFAREVDIRDWCSLTR